MKLFKIISVLALVLSIIALARSCHDHSEYVVKDQRPSLDEIFKTSQISESNTP